MPSYSRIVIIYNPNSTGASRENAQRLRRKLNAQYDRLAVEVVATKYAGHAEEIAYDTAKANKRPLIISSSGDGGYNEVVNGAVRAQQEGANPICAVLPSGNANDHRRTLKRNPLADAIANEDITNIDLLKAEINGDKREVRYAHSYIGLGLTPVAAVELNKQSLNAIRELGVVLRAFFKFRPFKLEVGGKVLTLDSILFTNIGQMAKILTVSKRAKADDGRFEVVTFAHNHKLLLIKKLLMASTAGLDQRKSYSDYSFKVLKKMPVQMDGEVRFLEKDSKVRITCQQKILCTIL